MVDALVHHAISGGVAVLAMVSTLVLVVWDVRFSPRPDLPATPRSPARWLVLLLPLAFLAARARIVLVQIASASAGEVGDAVLGDDSAFLALAGVAWVTLRPPRMALVMIAHLLARPALLLATSFGGLIAAGTLLLVLPISVRRMEDISFVDSLFTITSSVCVTGLTVNEPGATYTFFGQLVILAAIQLGGIGIMTIAALVPLLGQDRSLQERARFARVLDVRSLGALRATVFRILVVTFTIEAIGTVLLWLCFRGDPSFGYPIWFAVFHSISAFCNAGISVFRGNFIRFAGDPFVLGVVMALIFLGSIGFPVLAEAGQRAVARLGRLVGRRTLVPPRWSLGSRTALQVSAVLLVVGAVVIAALEARGSFAELGWGKGVLAAVFTSVTARTAGFATVDMANFSDATLLVLIVLMFIGGSPGSTAGGIKTTTLAVILAAFRAEIRGGDPHLGLRRLPEGAVRRATAVTAASLSIALCTLLFLTLSEDQPFVHLAFETISALGTVGLSAGVTTSLSTPGKLAVVVTMFVGRVGPLTVALAVGQAVARRRFRRAEEDLPIG